MNKEVSQRCRLSSLQMGMKDSASSKQKPMFQFCLDEVCRGNGPTNVLTVSAGVCTAHKPHNRKAVRGLSLFVFSVL